MQQFCPCRLKAPNSYFQTLPAEINKVARPFEKSCACGKALTKKCADDGIPVDWPMDKTKHYNRIKMCDRSPTKDRKRRDIEGSDELTHEDFEVLTPLKSNDHQRKKRSVVSKDNATRYCAERLLETKVGKLCAKLGTNVQGLVDVCSADIEVGFCHCLYLTQKGFDTIFELKLSCSLKSSNFIAIAHLNLFTNNNAKNVREM